MKTKASIFVIALVHLIVSVINFESLVFGNSVLIHHLLASVSYILFWLFIFLITKDQKDSNFLNFCIGFWKIVALSSFLLFLVNIFNFEAFVIFVLIGIFLTPLYGFKIATSSYIVLSIIYFLISLCFILIGKKHKKLNMEYTLN